MEGSGFCESVRKTQAPLATDDRDDDDNGDDSADDNDDDDDDDFGNDDDDDSGTHSWAVTALLQISTSLHLNFKVRHFDEDGDEYYNDKITCFTLWLLTVTATPERPPPQEAPQPPVQFAFNNDVDPGKWIWRCSGWELQS